MKRLPANILLSLVLLFVVISVSCSDRETSGLTYRPNKNGKQQPLALNQEIPYDLTMVIYGTTKNPFWDRVVTGAMEMAEQLGEQRIDEILQPVQEVLKTGL